MKPTNYKTPHTGDALLRVKFRRDSISKEALPASKWNWANRDYDWDITHWKED